MAFKIGVGCFGGLRFQAEGLRGGFKPVGQGIGQRLWARRDWEWGIDAALRFARVP
jgi:hypothetical protein